MDAQTSYKTTAQTAAFNAGEQALGFHREAVALFEGQVSFAEKQMASTFDAFRQGFAMQTRAAESFGRVWVDAFKPAASPAA